MTEHVTNATVTSQTSTSPITTFTTEQTKDRAHSCGPLDGSPYAKIYKYKKLNGIDADHVTKLSISAPIQTASISTIKEDSSTNQEPDNHELTNQLSPTSKVFVLDGNKIFYRPSSDIDIQTFVSAPLATLPEFNEPFLSNTSSHDSFTSLENCTRHSVTSSRGVDTSIEEKSEHSLQNTKENMAEGGMQQTAAEIVNDVIQKTHDDVTRLRYSEISSCSAATLSSTTTEEGDNVHAELSENDTSSECDSLEDQLLTLEGNISPSTVRGNSSPELILDETLDNLDENDPFDDSETQLETQNSVELSLGKPPPLPQLVVTTKDTSQSASEGMHNGGIGKYGSEYAVPMRDMKITTIPSKRALLLSNDSEEFTGTENMANQVDRRDSVYDEGNSYSGAGYATIDEYGSGHHMGAHQHTMNESNIPDDVQELLNGLQDGPAISDIDSGFHGSSMALPRDRSASEHYNMRSQSSGEFSDPFSPQSLHSNEPSPSSGDINFHASDKIAPGLHHTDVITSPVASYCSQGSGPGDIAQGSEQQVVLPPKRNKLPSVTTSTQTFPEPKEAQIQIITMKNVYKTEQILNSQPMKHGNETFMLNKTVNNETGYNNPSKTITTTVEQVTMPSIDTKMTSVVPKPQDLRHEQEDVIPDPYYGDMDDQLEIENMINVEEQIKHTQKHLQFLQDQQEKLKQRKQDRSNYRNSLRRNSSVFENYTDEYTYSPGVSSTLPRQPQKPIENRRVENYNASIPPQPYQNNMPPITSVNQSTVGVSPMEQNQSQNPWQQHGRSLTRQASDSSHNRNGPLKSPVRSSDRKTEHRVQDNDDIIMSSDLQEQLAELDRCIAQLTTSMDVPIVPEDTVDSKVVKRRKSFTLEIERKMDPNTPDADPSSMVVPRPPARSRSSFDSFRRLSQECDVVIKGKGDQDGNDDVFSVGPQLPRKKKQSTFPPQTSVTRRQNVAPPPPPKHRISLEERLSPGLMQAMSMNPGAKPKENIHSYKEDLAPEVVPDTPTFPLTPSTPYVNADSPGRSKSPPGLQKTALSILQLKPTETPTESLHHMDPNKVRQQPIQQQTAQNGVHQNSTVRSPDVVTTVVAMQNGHSKETALLNDNQMPVTKIITQQQEMNRTPVQLADRQNHVGFAPDNNQNGSNGVHTKVISVKRDVQTTAPPSHLHLQQMNAPQGHVNLQQQPHVIEQSPNTPQQYLLNHSGGSHSSHSPAATSSNSRHGSSDSLDGPSTRHSNSSLLSSSSSSSAAHHGMPMPSPSAFTSPNTIMRPGSQMSSYDRNTHNTLGGTRSGDESFGSPHSGRTSTSSISDAERMNNEQQHPTVSAAPKFIRDTTAYWYKPDITRDQALAILRSKQPGSFVVRDSRCFPGAFGLALKVDKLPPNIQPKPGVDLSNEYVRHFLIEPSSRGVKLKGCPNEPVFGSLSALVYQHSITPLALPCKLIVPTADQVLPTTPQSGNTPRNSQSGPEPTTPTPANSAVELLKLGAACNVIYIGSVDTESLTGPLAIERAVKETYDSARTNSSLTSTVHFKVSPQGITLTDNARKLFFRRHYPTSTVTFCGLDPQGSSNKGTKMRRWDASALRGSPDAWIFGFVARKQAGSRDNTCHVFAELDSVQPARAIVNFVMKVLIGSNRQNST